MVENQFNTPILFLIFNRPDTTERVFSAIREIQPKQLYIAGDGPRVDRPDDIEKCKQTREVVSKIDWPCEVKTLFREENLGCKIAVSSAIDWFFKNVEEGIILEDDCLPIESFFLFCEEMLKKYKDLPEVMMISGTNFLFGKYDKINSYFFSNLPLIWGWATWKRTWQQYPKTNIPLNSAEILEIIKPRYRRQHVINWIKKMIESAIMGKINTWDAQLVYTICKNKGLAITPFRNQISNIGYSGTHSRIRKRKDPFLELPTKKLILQDLIHPPLPPATNWMMDNFTGKMLEKYQLGGFISLIKHIILKPLKIIFKK